MGKKYSDYAEELSKQLIEMVDQGQAPWQRGYNVSGFEAESYTTGRTYSSGNGLKLLLTSVKNNFEDNRWITAKQAEKLGGTPKGEGVEILYYTDEKSIRVKDEETGKFKYEKVKLSSPILKTSTVYNVEQVDNIELKKLETPKSLGWKDADLLEVIRDKTQADVTHSSTVEGGTPAYFPELDKIMMPPPEAYDDPRRYASSLLHETVHWTGAEKRLNRDLSGARGTSKYAREELVAEISAMLIGGRTGIDTFVENNEAYIAGYWQPLKSALEENPTMIMGICKDAYASRDYITEGKELDRLAKASVSHAVELSASEKESGRINLDIPFSEKNNAKALARSLDVDLNWDTQGKTWYANVTDGQNIGSLAAYRVQNDSENEQTNSPKIEESEKMRIDLSIGYTQKDAAKYHAKELGIPLKFDGVEKTWFTEIAEGEELKLDQLKELISPSPTIQKVAPQESKEEDSVSSDSNKSDTLKALVAVDYEDKDRFKEHAKEAGVKVIWDKDEKKFEISTEAKNEAAFKDLIQKVDDRNKSKEALPAQKSHDQKNSEESVKVYLDIPFEAKDSIKAEAKESGMPLKWDGEVRSWFTYQDKLQDKFKQYIPDQNKQMESSKENTTADALRDVGAANPAESLIFDGQFHRLKADGDKGGTKSISYKAFNNGVPNASITNHKTGVKLKWVGKNTNLSKEEIARLQFINKKNMEAQKAELKKAQNKTASKAKEILSSAVPATTENSYLAKKGVGAHGLKQDSEGKLLVPVQNHEGEIKSLQTISPEGEKRFLKNGELAGNFHTLGKISDGNSIIITEGIATAATLHETTGKPTVVAFNASNLIPVTEGLKKSYPNSPLVIAADNDHTKPLLDPPKANVGLEKAKEAAKKTDAVVTYPKFSNSAEDAENSDFNDLMKSKGHGAVRDEVSEALSQARGLKKLRGQEEKSQEKSSAKHRDNER